MQNDSIKVMQVITNLDIGGAQEVVRTLAENMARSGCQVVVCAFKDGPLRLEIERQGIPVEILPARKHSLLAFPLFLKEMLDIRNILADLVRRHHINVVQTHLLRSLDFLVLTLRFRTELQVFWTIHNAEFTLRKDHLKRHRWMLAPKRLGYRWLYRQLAHWVSGFIAVSEDVKTAILAEMGPLPESKVVVIRNSVDTVRFQKPVDRLQIREKLGLPPDSAIFSTVANFKKQKGHRYLVEAASTLVHQFPGVHLLLIGDGELRAELQETTKALGLEEHIHFLGSRPDVPDLLAASDYFVLPSLWEGLPMALIEAMASGLPVIATNVSGSNEVVIPGETGLLIPPGDTAALQEAMVQMLSDPAKARSMGEASRRRIDSHFGATKQVQEYLELYMRSANKSLYPLHASG